MSIATKFQSFCSDIRISGTVAADVSYRYKRITRQLNQDFWGSDSETSHSLYAGSYGRDTAIHVSDIDMLMQLPYQVYVDYHNYHGNGQSALLQAIKASLQKTYSSSHLKGDGQVVVIAFKDGIRFEVLPCFINKDGSFTYPDTNGGGSWKTTDPSKEIRAIREGNDRWNGNLKNLCRMARAWKDRWDVPIGGLLIDTLAHQFMNGWEHSGKSYLYYDFMVRDFFYYVASQDEDKQYWLAPGSGKRVYREGKFEYKATRCFNLACEAITYENSNMPATANGKWREIFGTKFKG